ncbi:MAG: response regulator [Myxococcota bacterium]
MTAARVVVAEDDDELRALVVRALRADGYAVDTAATGLELADRLFADEIPDVVVTDVRMPGVSGLAALRGIRARAWATPVILVTAFPDAALIAEAMSLGAVVLGKPFAIEDLRRLVRVAAR